MSGIVILGGGECGVRAGFAARDAGYTAPVTIIAEEKGLPYERPPLSKPDDSGIIHKPICTAEILAERGMTLLDGVRATEIDRAARTVTMSSGGLLDYDKLLFATGASPRRLDCRGAGRALTFRTAHDAQRIYRIAQPGTRVVIIGAGLIGLELAALLAQRRVQVTVLEYGPHPLGRNVPRRLAEKIVDRHLAAGTEIFCGVQVERITPSAVVLADDRSFAADLVVAAIGVTPRSDLATAAGLATDNGICVDTGLRTADPHIYAAGDCASVQRAAKRQRFETWQNAQIQGDVAGRNMAGGQYDFDAPVWFWSDQFELGLQGVGDTSGMPSATRDRDGEILFYLNHAGKLAGAIGLGVGTAVAKDIKLAQKLIEADVEIAAEDLCNPDMNLKKLLRPAAAV